MEKDNISKNMTADKAVDVIKENLVTGEMLMGLCDYGLVKSLLENEELDEGVKCLIADGYTEFEIGFAIASAILTVTIPEAKICVIGLTNCTEEETESDAAINN